MTPIHSAASADQQIWPDSLRIFEAPQKSQVVSKGNAAPYTDLVRTLATHLQSGWRWLERKRTSQLASRRLRVSETISLGEKRSVSIVQVDGAQYLIGCSTTSVQLLAVLDKQDTAIVHRAENERAS